MTQHEPLMAPVYPSIGFEELGRVLRKAGYELEPVAGATKPSYQVLGDPRFMIELDTPFAPRPGEFCLITVSTHIPLAAPLPTNVLLDLQWQAMFARFAVNRHRGLVVTQAIVVNGGITEHYLKNQFWHWRQDLARARQVVRLSLARNESRTLH